MPGGEELLVIVFFTFFNIMGGVGVNMLDTYQDAEANIYLIEQISLFVVTKTIIIIRG